MVMPNFLLSPQNIPLVSHLLHLPAEYPAGLSSSPSSVLRELSAGLGYLGKLSAGSWYFCESISHIPCPAECFHGMRTHLTLQMDPSKRPLFSEIVDCLLVIRAHRLASCHDNPIAVRSNITAGHVRRHIHRFSKGE